MDSHKHHAITSLGGLEPLHVFDLPQMHEKPSAAEIRQALDLLSVVLPSFDFDPEVSSLEAAYTHRVLPDGVPRYLTNIIASPLAWIEDECEQESIRELASQRLTERSGRTAMRAVTRTFRIPTAEGDAEVELHEPALTGDNLGLKTWGSSYVLARSLHKLHLPISTSTASLDKQPMILELGAGTGLVGLAAAMVWQKHVCLTDLAEIEPNLARNVAANSATLAKRDGSAVSGVLDWQNADVLKLRTAPSGDLATCDTFQRAEIILAADPIYSPEHPRLLVQAISRWLDGGVDARVIVAYPLRDAYVKQIQDLKERLKGIGLQCGEQYDEVGRDDWAEEVQFAWGVWRWAKKTQD